MYKLGPTFFPYSTSFRFTIKGANEEEDNIHRENVAGWIYP